MFVIITYDVNEVRVNKVRKLLKKYITWTQNSVFEGEITEGKLNKCLAEINKITVDNEDSIYIYKISNPKNIKKYVIGSEKNFDDMFL
ncbi:CRISPR-associated endonuclease Cas2 [Clostridium paridis]|uniref:CRISPR-associated endoribonuclease Cas2 n=1 Tax=Clostridium paridis TaxID=2803863 RepID=A0A937FHZ9_9CLOT|nr:CRISPR-associated endonuclease Cas2 [Clostridium paridis]MBL4931891.1 CRISPR-associated endonuclease Cas2 [Clostridium paridis]